MPAVGPVPGNKAQGTRHTRCASPALLKTSSSARKIPPPYIAVTCGAEVSAGAASASGFTVSVPAPNDDAAIVQCKTTRRFKSISAVEESDSATQNCSTPLAARWPSEELPVPTLVTPTTFTSLFVPFRPRHCLSVIGSTPSMPGSLSPCVLLLAAPLRAEMSASQTGNSHKCIQQSHVGTIVDPKEVDCSFARSHTEIRPAVLNAVTTASLLDRLEVVSLLLGIYHVTFAPWSPRIGQKAVCCRETTGSDITCVLPARHNRGFAHTSHLGNRAPLNEFILLLRLSKVLPLLLARTGATEEAGLREKDAITSNSSTSWGTGRLLVLVVLAPLLSVVPPAAGAEVWRCKPGDLGVPSTYHMRI